MDVKLKVGIAFSVSENSLEDALAEYDELSVAGLIREIIAKVEDGPNTLEEVDALKGS